MATLLTVQMQRQPENREVAFVWLQIRFYVLLIFMLRNYADRQMVDYAAINIFLLLKWVYINVDVHHYLFGVH